MVHGLRLAGVCRVGDHVLLALGLCIAAVTFLLASPARAQGPSQPAAPEPELVAPKLQSDPVVEYPASASGDAEVVLELVIEKDGSVRSARTVQGESPFAEAAEAAALTWRFHPARRGDTAIAARIRFQLVFREPEPPPPEPPPVKPPEPPGGERPSTDAPREDVKEPPPKAPAAEPVLEVTVEGERPEVSPTSTLTRAEVRQLPGAFGDPFRAIEILPGVTPIISGLPYFFVRGAPPGNVGYFLDGIRVPYLFHLGLGPSVVHPGMVEQVDLYPGGYPARYGRYAGAIVAGETTPPSYVRRLEGNVRLIDTGVLLQAPGFDDRATFLVGARYSYAALLLSLLSQEVDLQYWDYQARVTYDLDEKNQLGVFSFGAFDRLADTSEEQSRTLFGVQFHRLDLRWRHQASARTRVDTAVTLGHDQTSIGDDERLAIIDRMIGARSSFHHRASKDTAFRGGVDLLNDFFSVDFRGDPDDPEGEQDEEEVNEGFPTRTDVALGFWSDVVHDYDPSWTVTAGARFDLYYSDRVLAYALEPRIASTHHVTDDFRLVHRFGLAHQPPSFAIPIPGFTFSALDAGLQQSVQSSSGVEVDLPKEYTASVTFFQNAFFEMTDVFGTGFEDEDLLNRSIGSTRGVEFVLKRPLSRKFGGFLSYTLSRSTRSIGRETFPSDFDRTHVFNVAAAYDLGRRWRAGGRGVFYTGTPFYPSLESANASTELFGDPLGDTLRTDAEERTSPFFRLDLRVEKQWPLGQAGYWALVFEMLNATLSKESAGVTCENGQCKEEFIGPISIPMIGVEAVL